MPNQDNWQLYYERTSLNAPRETLLKALEQFPPTYQGIAFDLGSGACNDVAHLLKLGWQVVAVDNEEKSAAFFKKVLGQQTNGAFQLSSFENIVWQKADLIHAGFALAFCPREHLKFVLTQIKENLKSGGIFAGNFFGPEHTWDDLCLLSKTEILDQFKDFEIIEIEETKKERLSTLNEKIFHHNISLIVQKP